jgi:PD-(D/E)XK nuclease superfamily
MNDQPTTSPRRDFYRGLAKLAKGLPRNDPAQALRYFRERIIPDPATLRRKMLGANAIRAREHDECQKAWRRILDVSPDLLSPLGDLRYEPAHARLIAFHLDAVRSRTLASGCTRALLALLQHNDDGPFSVSTEHYVANGRVDIRLESEQTIIFIELKVDSSEGHDQLRRYRKALERESAGRAAILVYMTAVPAESSSEQPDRHILLRELLRAWLPIAEGGLDEHGFLARYLKSLALLVGCSAPGRFEDWNFSTQRALLDLLEEGQA